jgi:hypothetical protein
MGFPPDFKIPVSDTQAYRQFGNSVVVPIVRKIADEVMVTLSRSDDYQPQLVLRPPDAPIKRKKSAAAASTS